MSRKCSNWLQTFLDWTLPRSESPDTFLVWSGLFAVSSVAKRHVRIPAWLTGSYVVEPYLYLLFVGPPGVARKTTTAGFAEKLLKPLRHVNIAATATSDSKFVEDMAAVADGSMSIISGEFASLVKTSEDAMFDLFTELFDGKDHYTYTTRMHGEEVINNPCLNMLACTTPEWVAHNPTYMTGGGFASRVIFLYEHKARQRRLFYKENRGKAKEFEQMEKHLRHDLDHIAGLRGEFAFESEALEDKLEAWYQQHVDSEIVAASVEGFHYREHVHLLKTCMLLSLCERDDLIITEAHIDAAQGLLQIAKKKMPQALATVGRNPLSGKLETIFTYIREQEEPTKHRIFRRFWTDLDQKELESVLAALIAMRRIAVTNTPNNPWNTTYKIID